GGLNALVVERGDPRPRIAGRRRLERDDGREDDREQRAKHAYSYRNALTGSSRVARRAGQKQAAIDTTTRSATIDIRVTGSRVPVWTSTLSSSLPTPSAPPMPIVRPTAIWTIDRRRINHHT